MYPLIRMATASIRAALSKPCNVYNACETSFICMPWDLDMFLEMNNGRVLTLYDIGRFHLAIRSGLAKVLKKNRWGLVVAGCSVRYRKRIRAFDKVTMRTQVISYDERWVYLAQSMWVKGEPASSILIRTGITAKGRTITTDRVVQAMNAGDWKPEPSPWLESWVASEQDRPWPPSS